MQAPRRRGGTFLLLVEDPAPVGTSAAASEYLSMLSCFVPPRSPPISLCPSSPDAEGLSKTEKRWRNRVAKERAGGRRKLQLIVLELFTGFQHACLRGGQKPRTCGAWPEQVQLGFRRILNLHYGSRVISTAFML